MKTICFCGSFKFYQQMQKAALLLGEQGLNVLVPQPSHIRYGHKPDELKSTKYDRKTLLKWESDGAYQHLANIAKSDAVYIFNQRSYVGPAVMVEIGYALALKKPIFAKAPIKDITVTNFVQAILSPKQLVYYLKRGKYDS